MFTIYDFINNRVDPKEMKFGWKAEIRNSGILSNEITLSYTMLNFDFKSTEYVNNELWNMFLKSEAYVAMRDRLNQSMKKFGRLFFSGCSIAELMQKVEDSGLKIDVEKLIHSLIEKKSEEIKEKIKEKNKKENDRDI